jgi:hypothetical protein
MTRKLTRKDAREAARRFTQTYVGVGRQWDAHALEQFLPIGLRLREDALFQERPTIGRIAHFLYRETVERRHPFSDADLYDVE